jgi:hypothetical protein
MQRIEAGWKLNGAVRRSMLAVQQGQSWPE